MTRGLQTQAICRWIGNRWFMVKWRGTHERCPIKLNYENDVMIEKNIICPKLERSHPLLTRYPFSIFLSTALQTQFFFFKSSSSLADVLCFDLYHKKLGNMTIKKGMLQTSAAALPCNLLISDLFYFFFIVARFFFKNQPHFCKQDQDGQTPI